MIINFKNLGASGGGVKVLIVTELPQTGMEGVWYLVPIESGTTGNLYTEYIWVKDEHGVGSWEKLGTKDIDFSNYYTKSETDGHILAALADYDTTDEINAKLSGYTTTAYTEQMELAIAGTLNLKQDKLTAGTNIDITDDVISVTGITVPTKTSDLTNDSDFMANPTGGTTGDVLTKTTTGYEWATGGGGSTEEIELPIAEAVTDLQEIIINDIYKKSEVNNNFAKKYELNTYALKSYVDSLVAAIYSTIEDKELAIAQAVNNLDSRVSDLEEE